MLALCFDTVVALKGNSYAQSLDVIQIISSTPSSSTMLIATHLAIAVACPGLSIASCPARPAFGNGVTAGSRPDFRNYGAVEAQITSVCTVIARRIHLWR